VALIRRGFHATALSCHELLYLACFLSMVTGRYYYVAA